MSAPLLPTLRRARWVQSVQVLLFLSWVLNPFPGAFSYWTNNGGGRTEVTNFPEGDEWYQQDSDSDGLNNAQEVQFGSDPYRLDSDLDGLPDSAEYQYSLDAITAGTLLPYDPWNWDSNGNGFSDFDEYYQQIQGYNPVVNYASLTAGTFYSYSDADGDGIKNFEDSEPMNTNRDGDLLLNWNEAPGQMDDPYNGAGPPNTDPPPPDDPGVNIGGVWYPAGTLDSDGDGTPDQNDSFPYGSFWYQGIEYGGALSDRDNDGIPDVTDPFPDGSYWYNAAEYAAPWVDQDGDGIPDGLDPWPTMAGSYTYNGTEYPGLCSMGTTTASLTPSISLLTVKRLLPTSPVISHRILGTASLITLTTEPNMLAVGAIWTGTAFPIALMPRPMAATGTAATNTPAVG